MKKKTWFLSTLLVATVVGTSWLTLVVTKEIAIAHFDSPKNIDTFMHTVLHKQFDINGDVRILIRAPTIEHYPQNDEYIFSAPQMVVFANQKQIWTISADKGKSNNHSEIITLWGNVTIDKESTAKQAAMTLKTNSIQIFPEQRSAETKDAVQIKQGENIIQAVGAIADFNSGTVKLLSKVAGKYMIEVNE